VREARRARAASSGTMSVMDSAALAGHLEKHLRVATFPVGVRTLAPGDAAPEKARRPKAQLGVQITVCQGIAYARRYGWTMAISREDVSCPIAKAVFGFEPRNAYYESGALADGMYAGCREAGARFEAVLAKYEPGECGTLLAGPLARIAYEPESVVVYGNSAQVLRLVNASLFERGGEIQSACSGRADCSDIVIRSAQSKVPQLVLPCYGDRLFGMAADDEMAFTFPWSMREEIVRGLEGTHAGGVRYPVPVHLRFQAEFPKTYQELERLWSEQEPKDRG
jgi:uncharacterized protein (DUF169 family)